MNENSFLFPMLAGAISSKNNTESKNHGSQMSPYMGGINGN